MLRLLFGESRRKDEGKLAETIRLIRAFTAELRNEHRQERIDPIWIRLDMWANGLVNALDELEQSVYCSEKFADRVWPKYEDELTPRERDDYRRFLYFYKNGFVRLFSTLDKTGYFLDLLFHLNTGKTKPKFSYFTVLRQMHLTERHTRLEQPLFELKVKYRQPLDRLRRRRNLEIHSMNVELIDDTWRMQSKFADRLVIEQISDHLQDLRIGYDMVLQSLIVIFQYSIHEVKQGRN